MFSAIQILFGAFACSVVLLSCLYSAWFTTKGPCLILGQRDAEESEQPSTAFTATRLTSSTFLIKERDDIYSEHPYIYAKVVPSASTILLLDSGCGGASNDPTVEVTSLRKFIETVRLKDNGGKPLNKGSRMRYVIVTSHCHYDHILGVEQFAADSPILASGHSPSFLSPENLPIHSLCKALNIPTPVYMPVLVPHLHDIRSEGGDLGMTVLHTPGHTPDELALYDAGERMLYVGDSLYEYEPIIFPKEGSIVTWFSSVDFLISWVKSKNDDINPKDTHVSLPEVQINAGHRTVSRPALEVLHAAKAFLVDVVAGREEIMKRTVKRDEVTVEYRQNGGRFSLICPERLIEEAREMRMV